MLKEILGKLPDFLSKRFLLGAAIPALVTSLSTWGLLYLQFQSVQRLTARYENVDTIDQALGGLGLVGFLGILAFVCQVITPHVRRALEGSIIPRSVRAYGEMLRYGSYTELEKKVEDADRERHGVARIQGEFTARLKAAKESAVQLPVGSMGNGQELMDLTALFRQNATDPKWLSTAEELEKLVQLLVQLLAASNTMAQPPAAEKALSHAETDVKDIVIELKRRHDVHLATLKSRLDREFPGQQITVTRMGALSAATESYAETRYGIDYTALAMHFELFIAGMKDSPLPQAINDAETQLAFCLNMLWLTLVFFSFWLVAYVAHGNLLWIYLVLSVLAPLLLALWYSMSVISYDRLGQLIKSAIDTSRRDLLVKLSVAPPSSLQDEIALWTAMSLHLRYAERFEVPLTAPSPAAGKGGGNALPQAAAENGAKSDRSP